MPRKGYTVRLVRVAPVRDELRPITITLPALRTIGQRRVETLSQHVYPADFVGINEFALRDRELKSINYHPCLYGQDGTAQFLFGAVDTLQAAVDRLEAETGVNSSDWRECDIAAIDNDWNIRPSGLRSLHGIIEGRQDLG
jgi:hypothetical protein